MNEVKLCEYKTEWFRGTNTGHGEAIFSIKRRKFVKPTVYWGAVTKFYYTLLRGRYIRLRWSWWNKREPEHRIYVAIIDIDGDKVETIREGAFAVNSNYDFENEILSDFFNARPSYHGRPAIDFNKVYTEEQVKQLIEFAENAIKIVEGQEYE